MHEFAKTVRGLAANILLVIRRAFRPAPIPQPIPVPKAPVGIRRGDLRR